MEHPEVFDDILDLVEEHPGQKETFKHKLGKWLSIILPFLLGVFLIYYSYSKFTPEQLAEIQSHFKSANYNCIYLSLFVALLGSVSRGYRWKYSLDHMGYKSNFANNFMAVNISYIVNMTIPRSGEITRALILKKYDNIPFNQGFGSIIAERIVDLVLLIFFIMLCFFLQYDVVEAFIIEKIPVQKLILLSVVGFVAMVVSFLVYKYSKSKIILNVKGKVAGVKEGLLSLIHMKKKWEYLFHTVFIWFSYVFMFYVATFVIPETSTISFGAVLTSFVVGSIAIAFTNSGFGSYPFLIAKILLFYSIPETAGSAFGWIIWTSQMVLLVVLGGLSFLLLPFFNKRK